MENLCFSESSQFRQFWFEKVDRLSLNEKIQVAYEFLKWRKVLPTMQKQSSKSAAKATEYKNLGNNEFRCKNYIEAANFYTKSVSVAPVPSTELAIAYANRSAVMAKITRDRECLLDINRALQLNYPETGKQKLLDRKIKCIIQFRIAMSVAKEFSSSVTYAFKTRLGVVVEELDKEFDPDRAEPLETHALRFRAPKMDFKNKLIPNASEKIEIKCDSENRTSVIATARIKPGEILAIEKPYAANLAEEYRYTNCANCFLRCEALIHCPTCSMVMFCSEICRKNAFETFHRIECQIFSMFPIGKEDNISLNKWAAFRTLLVATKQGKELDQLMNHPVYKLPLATKFGRDLKEKFNSEDYSSVFYHGKRSRSNKLENYGSEFSLSVFVNVAKWLYLLRHTSFFGELEDKKENLDAPLSDRELYVAAFFLRSLQSDFRFIKEGTEEKMACDHVQNTFSPIGIGIFPLMNRFDHSCDPHVMMFSYENTLVCRAIRPIKAGEQIFDCYTRLFHQGTKYQRNLELKERFNFECNCKPCEMNWPIFDKLPKTSKVISDKSNKVVDLKKFAKYTKKFEKLRKQFEYGDLHDPAVVEFLCKFLCMLNKMFQRPHKDAIDCETYIERHYSAIANFYSVEEGEEED
ncbi:hypothetical protein V9T40_005402 [Parthenolecanium corni]|uniref:SET and MYND domain-containing protein 4 n=1 Tax=Parthenolecanium corni TaxID=536013 RepID=A0AAN9Y4Q6_9HEMI